MYRDRHNTALEKTAELVGLGFEPEAYLRATLYALPVYNAYFFCNRFLIKKYIAFAEAMGLKWEMLIWWKPNGMPAHGGHYPPDKEYLFYMRGKGAVFNNKLKTDFYRTVKMYCVGKKLLHPNQKPLELIKQPMLVSSLAGQTVLDPFMGSGTVGVAAVQTGRKYIGVEKREDVFDLAVRRIEAAVRQGNLF